MGEIAERRRRQILEAATVCFARRGFHRATMPEICAEAALSPGSVYRYFRGKEEIIEAIVEEDLTESLGAIERLARIPDSRAALAAAVAAALATTDPIAGVLTAEVVAEATRNPRVGAMVHRHEAAVVGALAAVVRRGQTRGEIDGTLDPTHVATLVASLVEDVTIRRALAPEEDLAGYAALLRDALVRLLRPAATGTEHAG